MGEKGLRKAPKGHETVKIGSKFIKKCLKMSQISAK